MAIHGVAQIARHQFLQPCAKLAAEPRENVLECDRGENDQHHRLQRCHLVGRIEEVTDGFVQHALHATRRDLLRGGRRNTEQGLQKRNQQRQRRHIEHGDDQIARDRGSHAP